MSRNLTEYEQARAILAAGLERVPLSTKTYRSVEPLPPGVLAAVAGAMTQDDWTELRYETPTRAPTAQGDVIVPLAQASVSGILAAAICMVGGLVLAARGNVTWWLPVALAVVLGLIVSALVWWRLLIDQRRLLRRVEVLTRRDDARDLAREPEQVRFEVQVARDGRGPQTLFEDLPIHPGMFRAWARSVLEGRSLAQAAWTGGNRPFSRADYEDLLAFLDKAQVIRWVNPEAKAQGRELTPWGRVALRRYLGMDD